MITIKYKNENYSIPTTEKILGNNGKMKINDENDMLVMMRNILE